MSRKTAREIVMQYVYQMEVNNDFSTEKLLYYLDDGDINESDKIFIRESIDSIINNLEDIDKNIDLYLEGWKMERIPKVDLSILRVAINEIDYKENIPDSVAINEAVDMAKKYSTDDSYKYINGVLGSYHRSIGGK